MIPAIVDSASMDMTSIYVMVGGLVVGNLVTISAGVVFIIKLAWRAAKYDSRIEKMEKDINAAFKLLRDGDNDF